MCVVTGTCHVVSKQPIMYGHCCLAQWTNGLSFTLSLNPHFLEDFVHILYILFSVRC